MFDNCKNLKYINLKNAIEHTNLYCGYVFKDVPENIVYCVYEKNAPKLNSILKGKMCSTLYCLDNWKEKQKKNYL